MFAFARRQGRCDFAVYFVRIRRKGAVPQTGGWTLSVRTGEDCAPLSVRPMGLTSREKGTKVLPLGGTSGSSTSLAECMRRKTTWGLGEILATPDLPEKPRACPWWPSA